jgi:hypothetical protein
MALIERELKRDKLVAKYAKKHAELKGIANDPKRSDDERAVARLALQKLPRNANPTRQRNRCEITGRPPWHVPALRSGTRQDPRNGHGRGNPGRGQGQLVSRRRH